MGARFVNWCMPCDGWHEFFYPDPDFAPAALYRYVCPDTGTTTVVQPTDGWSEVARPAGSVLVAKMG